MYIQIQILILGMFNKQPRCHDLWPTTAKERQPLLILIPLRI